jgi:hypothetical protein
VELARSNWVVNSNNANSPIRPPIVRFRMPTVIKLNRRDFRNGSRAALPPSALSCKRLEADAADLGDALAKSRNPA